MRKVLALTLAASFTLMAAPTALANGWDFSVDNETTDGVDTGEGPPPNPPPPGPPPCVSRTIIDSSSGSFTLDYKKKRVSGNQPFWESNSADGWASKFGGWGEETLSMPGVDEYDRKKVASLVGGTWSYRKTTVQKDCSGIGGYNDGGFHDSTQSETKSINQVRDFSTPTYRSGWCATKVRLELEGPFTRSWGAWPSVDIEEIALRGADSEGWVPTTYGQRPSKWKEECIGVRTTKYKLNTSISERGRYTGFTEARGDKLALYKFGNGIKWEWTGKAGKDWSRAVIQSDNGTPYKKEGVYRTINCENDTDNPATKIAPSASDPLNRDRAAWTDSNQYYYTESYGTCNGDPTTGTDVEIPPGSPDDPQDPDNTGGTPDTPVGSIPSLPQIGIRCEADRQYPKYTLADGTERTNGSDIVQVRADNKVTKIDWMPNNPVGVEVTGGGDDLAIQWRSRFTLSPTIGENSPSLLTGDVNDPEQPYGTVAHKDIDQENTNPTSTWFDLDRWVDEDGKRVRVSADRQEAPVAGFGVRFADSSKVDYTKSEDGKPPVGRHWRTTPEWEATFKVNTRVLQNDSFNLTSGIGEGRDNATYSSSTGSTTQSYATKEVQLTYVCLGRDSRLQAQRVSTVPTE